LPVALPIFTRVVYDRVIPNFAEATLWVLLSGMILVLVFEILFKLSRSYIMDHLGHKAGAQMEQQFHTHLLHLPHGFNIARTGQYFSHLQEIRDFFCQKLVPTLIDTPFVLSFLLVIFLICPPMVLVPVIIGGILVGVQYAFHRALHKGMLNNQRAEYARQNALVESLNGRDTIRQMACYQPFQTLWKDVTDKAAQAQATLCIWQGLVSYLCYSAIILNSVLLIIVGVYQIHDNNLTVGGLLAISLLSARALSPLTAIGGILAKWPHMQTEMKAIETILALPVEPSALSATRFVLQGDITLRDVNVQYPERTQPALSAINLQLCKGQKLALIGASGAGKSTLLKVLSAEVPIQTGDIRWDDHNIQHIAPGELRSQIGIVDQYPYFFERTLRENMLMGMHRSDDDIRYVLDIVGMHDFIHAMGQGLDLKIAEGGLNLSGGQRQCFAIARALLRDPAVLLMDEPTSMMDHQMESRLVQKLKTVLQDKMVVIATHRTPLLSLVDTIAMLENGKFKRYGNRNDILKELSHAATG
jgi:ATP-binding cassette, subfamily C, bacterial LapB